MQHSHAFKKACGWGLQVDFAVKSIDFQPEQHLLLPVHRQLLVLQLLLQLELHGTAPTAACSAVPAAAAPLLLPLVSLPRPVVSRYLLTSEHMHTFWHKAQQHLVTHATCTSAQHLRR